VVFGVCKQNSPVLYRNALNCRWRNRFSCQQRLEVSDQAARQKSEEVDRPKTKENRETRCATQAEHEATRQQGITVFGLVESIKFCFHYLNLYSINSFSSLSCLYIFDPKYNVAFVKQKLLYCIIRQRILYVQLIHTKGGIKVSFRVETFLLIYVSNAE